MEQSHKKIEFPGLPLAVYREIAAHLRQVEGVNVDLIPQTTTDFNYYQSQIAGLSISWVSNTNESQIERILDYYEKRYGNFHL